MINLCRKKKNKPTNKKCVPNTTLCVTKALFLLVCKWLTSDLFNALNTELNPICCLLALLGAHHFLHVSKIRVKSLTLRLLMSYIYGAPILDVSRSHTTVGRTPLDEWSARRRDLYLTTHDTHNRQISMPPVGFKPTISAGERPQAAHLLCDELITRPEESYRLCCVVVCDLETSRIVAPYIYIYVCVYIYMYIYICVCVCVCVTLVA